MTRIVTRRVVCDRCNETADTQTDGLPVGWGHIDAGETATQAIRSICSGDLCPDCVGELRTWWASPGPRPAHGES